jgi:DNA-binding NarL/FixJ family response regulator
VIRVLLADDQTLVRQGITSLLALTTDVRVVAEASDGDDALAAIDRGGDEVDVVLLDVRMPKRTGLAVLEELAKRAVAPPVILLTTFDDDSVALDGVRLGARGFLLKDVTLEQLANAIRVVASGGTLIKPAVTARVQQAFAARGPLAFESTPRPEGLTAREIEVLRLLATGASNREIADALGTAEGTVKNQVSSIIAKLGVRDRTRAVLKGIEIGYV